VFGDLRALVNNLVTVNSNNKHVTMVTDVYDCVHWLVISSAVGFVPFTARILSYVRVLTI
jgi:hypothetical protein